MRLRPATAGDVEGIARVHVESWRTTYRGIVPEAFLARLSYEARQRQWRRVFAGEPANGHVGFVVEAEAGEIVGFADGGPERTGEHGHDAELYAIYLLAEHQGRGLGRQLVRSVAGRLAELGHRSMLVWVLRENPACRFYAALGGRLVATRPIEIGGATLDEVAYGWPDINLLTASSSP